MDHDEHLAHHDAQPHLPRHQPTLAEIAQATGLYGQPTYASQLAAQRTRRAQMSPEARAIRASGEAPCNLCGQLTPCDWLQPEPYQEWDALCPRCLCRAQVHSWQVHAQHQAKAREMQATLLQMMVDTSARMSQNETRLTQNEAMLKRLIDMQRHRGGS